jgi:hypothetical protein
MSHAALEQWLNEEDAPLAGAAPMNMGGQQPAGDGMAPPDQNPTPDPNAPPEGDPNITNPGQQPPEDISQDPATPEMPEEKPEVDDFETWRNQYLVESIKGDTNKLVSMLSMVRDKEGLHSYQKKFVEDNYNIQLIRLNANVEKASQDIRRNVDTQLDKHNPATTVVNHMAATLETVPNLNNIFIKLNGYAALKSDLHRKYLAALLGAVQVGSGADSEDIIYNRKDCSIMISTRMNSEWGDVVLGNWSLKEDDPDHYLSESEKKRLEEGSPEEKSVLKRRIILDSIAHQYEERAFIINIVGDDGTIYTLGWDIAGSLKAAYSEGKIKVKTKTSENSEAMITDDGQIIPFMDLDIVYAKETGQQNEDGSPETKDLPFIEKRKGLLMLAADLNTIREASTSMQGIVFKETPYNGNPSDLQVLSRCVYTSHDLLMRTCQ